MAISKTDIAKLYIAMFDRAPEGEGLDYWYGKATNGESLEQIANEMASAAKAFPDDYPQYANYDANDADSVKAVIDAVYKVLFNKDSSTDPEGVNYWVNHIVKDGWDLGKTVVTMENAAEEYLNSKDEAAKAAAQTFVNRAEVAVYSAEKIQKADVDGDGKIDFDTFKNFITSVTDDKDSITTAKSSVDEYTPVSVDLTTEKDTITGSKAADTFNAPLLTLNDGDNIDGKDGIDTLNAEINGNVSSNVKVSNVENINVTSYGNNQVDMAGMSGVETIKTVNSTGTLSVVNIASTDIGIGLEGASQNIQATFKDTTGTADNLNVTLKNASKAQISSLSTGFESAKIKIDGDSSLQNFNNAPAKITIEGKGNFSFDDANAAAGTNVFGNVSLFDASGLNGNLVAGSDTNNDGFNDTEKIQTATTGATIKLAQGENNVVITDNSNTGTSNVIYGGDNKDMITLENGSGNNVLMLGKGDDSVLVSNAATQGLTNGDVLKFGEGNDSLVIANTQANTFIVNDLENVTLKATAGTNTITSNSALNVTAEAGNAGAQNAINIQGLYKGSTVHVVNAKNQTVGSSGLTVAYAAQEPSTTITVDAKLDTTLSLTKIKDATVELNDKVGNTTAAAITTQGVDSLTLKTAKAATFGNESDSATTDTLKTITAQGQNAVTLGNLTSTALKDVNVSGVKNVNVGAINTAAQNNLSTVKVSSTEGSATVGAIGVATTNEIKEVSVNAKTNANVGAITAVKIDSVSENADTGTLTLGNITASQDLGDVTLKAKGNLAGVAGTTTINGATIKSVTINSTNGTISNINIANANATEKVGDINITAGGNVTLGNIGNGNNDTFTKINVTSNKGSVGISGITAGDSDGFDLTISANGTSGAINNGTANTAFTVSNQDGNINNVILNAKGSANVNFTVTDSGTTGAYYVKSVDASNVLGGFATIITNADDLNTVDSTTTVKLGANASGITNTVNLNGHVDTLNVTGSKGADTINFGTVAGTTDNYKTATIDLGTGTDTINFSNFNMAGTNATALIANFSSQAKTYDGQTVSAGHVVEWDGNNDGTNNVTNSSDAYVKNVEQITATSGNDVIYASDVGMTITAGAGNDTITLGAGTDTVVFSANNGIDTISNLDLGTSSTAVDKLDVSDLGLTFADGADILAKNTAAYSTDVDVLVINNAVANVTAADNAVESWSSANNATNNDLIVLWQDSSNNHWHIAKAVGGTGANAGSDGGDEYTTTDLADLGAIDISNLNIGDFVFA